MAFFLDESVFWCMTVGSEIVSLLVSCEGGMHQDVGQMTRKFSTSDGSR
jgi:hypothetical protein